MALSEYAKLRAIFSSAPFESVAENERLPMTAVDPMLTHDRRHLRGA